MKSLFKLFVFMLSAAIIFPAGNLRANSAMDLDDIEPVISMDFQDANLKDILKVFSIQSGLNFIASEAVQERKVTLYMDQVPLKMAMDKIFKANNLSYELDKEAGIFIVKDWGLAGPELLTKVFYLKHATVSSSSLKEEMSNIVAGASSGFSLGESSDSSGASGGGGSGKWAQESESGITSVVKKLLSEVGCAIEDFRTNSIIVSDTPQRMSVISQVIASLDVPIPQVLLEVEMIDVSKGLVDKMGFNFSDAGSFAIQVISAAKMTTFPLSAFAPEAGIGGLNRVASGSAVGGVSQKFSPGEINFPTNLKLVFDFLKTQTDTKFLARPRILTLNNEPAEIRIATNEAVGVTTTTEASTATTSAEPERVETGVILRVIPQVNVESGDITMFVYPKVAEAVQGNVITSGGQEFQFRDPEERSTKSLVKIKDGETVVIGGLIRNEKTELVTKLPILGDIPVLGALFRHKNKSRDRERELLVFITPHIIKDKGIKLAQGNAAALPEREQIEAFGVNRENLIDSSLNVFEE